MAITYDSAGALVTAESSGGALSPLCPATVTAGDILIAHAWYEGTTTAPSTPADWTLLSGPHTVESAYRHWVFGKIADGTEDGSAVAFGTPAVTTMRAARVYRFLGRTTGTIEQLVRGFAHLSNATDPQMPTVTTVGTGSLAVGLVGQADDNAQASATGESGGDWTLATEANSAATTPDVSLSVQTAAMATPATISGGSVSTANDPCGVIAFEIRTTSVMSGAVVTPVTFGPVVNGNVISPRRGRVSYAMLETPAVAAITGAVAFPFTLTEIIAGIAICKASVALPITAEQVVTGRVTRYAASATPITFGTVTDGAVPARGIVSWAAFEKPLAVASGAVSLPVTFTSVTAGTRTVYGSVSSPTTFGAVAAGSRMTRAAVSLPITLDTVTDGTSTVFVQGAATLAVTLEQVTDSQVTAHSAIALPTTFTVTTTGTRTTQSAVSLPITLGVFTDGAVETGAETIFGAASLTVTDTITTNSLRTSYGAVVLPITVGITTTGVTAGLITGAASLQLQFAVRTGEPRIAAAGLVYLFGDAEPASGLLTARSAITLPITLGVETIAAGVITGATSSQWTLERTTAARVTARTQVAFPITLGVTSDGTTSGQEFGAAILPVAITVATRGVVTHKASSSFVATAQIVTAGQMIARSRVALPITFGITTRGTAAGQVAGVVDMPITVTVGTSGFATHYASSALAATIQITTAASAGMRSRSSLTATYAVQTAGLAKRFGSVALPVLWDSETRGTTAGVVTGRAILNASLAITTAQRLIAKSLVSLPITVTVATAPQQVAYASVNLPFVLNIKSGNPIYLSGINGYIAFVRPGRIANARHPTIGSVV